MTITSNTGNCDNSAIIIRVIYQHHVHENNEKNATLIRFVSDNVSPIRNCKRSGTIFGRTWLA